MKNMAHVFFLPRYRTTPAQHEMRSHRERCYPSMITEQWWSESYEIELYPYIPPLAAGVKLLLRNRQN